MTKPRLLLLPTFVFASFFGAGAGCSRVETRPAVGLQLWSLREEFKKDSMRALDLVRDMGFTEVETAGTAGMSAADYRAALEARGLKPVAAHVQYGAMEADLAKVVAEIKALGATYAFCPWIPHDGPAGFDAALAAKAAANFNTWGAAFRAEGIRFGYHVHGYEFVPGSREGETLFDDMVRATDPQAVEFQMDVFWVYRAAEDPMTLLKRYPTRWASIHIKDIRKDAERIVGSSGAPASDKVVIGTGAIDWPTLLRAAREQGVNHFVLEDESDAPLEQIPASMRYLGGLEF
jgi:sugar phosphate isomerase/epimerase